MWKGGGGDQWVPSHHTHIQRLERYGIFFSGSVIPRVFGSCCERAVEVPITSVCERSFSQGDLNVMSKVDPVERGYARSSASMRTREECVRHHGWGFGKRVLGVTLETSRIGYGDFRALAIT